MKQSFWKTKEGQKLVSILTIVTCYILMYGFLMTFLATADNSGPTFIIFIVVSMIFTYKSCKGMLVDSLSSLPLPAFILIVIMLSAVIGSFTAPYHIGKWLGQKINHFIATRPEKKAAPVVNPNNYTEAALRKMSVEELYKAYSALHGLISPAVGQSADRVVPYDTQPFGFKTVGEGRALLNLVQRIYNEKRNVSVASANKIKGN